MNKQELIDKCVHERKGVLGKGNSDAQFIIVEDGEFYALTRQYMNSRSEISSDQIVCTVEEFQQRARELGYVNGYRWGVEYPTNGKKPDLPDDVLVKFKHRNHGWINTHLYAHLFNLNDAKFKITDTRYKPADTSYLDKPDSSLDSESISIDNGENYNEGVEHFEWIANQFDNADDANAVWALRDKLFHKRKAEAERKRVIDAVCAAKPSSVLSGRELIEHCYDAGFLRMPEGK